MSFNSHVFKEVNAHTKRLFDIKWNNEGNYVGTMSDDKLVKISKLESSGGARVIQTVPTNGLPAQLCWDPTDGSRFVVCGEDKVIEIWDVRASKAAVKIKYVGTAINVDWSPDGHKIAVGDRRDNLTIFDVRGTGTQVCKRKSDYELNEFHWTANSDYIVASIGGEGFGGVDLIHYNTASNINNGETSTSSVTAKLEPCAHIPAHSSNALALKIDPTFSRMAVGILDFLVSLWHLDDLICHSTFSMESEIRALSYSPDGSHIVACSDDLNIVIANSDTGECISRINCRYKVGVVAWHPKHNIIAVAPDDKSSVPQYLRFISFPNSA